MSMRSFLVMGLTPFCLFAFGTRTTNTSRHAAFKALVKAAFPAHQDLAALLAAEWTLKVISNRIFVSIAKLCCGSE
jgi:hypothetical protein